MRGKHTNEMEATLINGTLWVVSCLKSSGRQMNIHKRAIMIAKKQKRDFYFIFDPKNCWDVIVESG